jgi:hypothetical protein
MSMPRPETTRVRGGGSARIGAVVVAVALGALVWIGIAERPAPGPVALLPTASGQSSKAPTDAPTDAPRLPPPSPITTPAPTPGPGETYGASLTIGNVRYVTILSELQPGHLTGELHFASPARSPIGTFAFSELWEDGHVDAAVAIGTWPVDLEAVSAATRIPVSLVNASFPEQSALWELPKPVARGYEIEVAGSNDLLFTRLSIDVTLGPNQARDDGAMAKVRFGVAIDAGAIHRAEILSPGENGSFKATFSLPKPRRAMTAQLHVSNVQLTASHDIWKEIDAFEFELTPDLAKVNVSRLIVDESTAAYRVMARTSGNVRGQSITVTVIALRISAAE